MCVDVQCGKNPAVFQKLYTKEHLFIKKEPKLKMLMTVFSIRRFPRKKISFNAKTTWKTKGPKRKRLKATEPPFSSESSTHYFIQDATFVAFSRCMLSNVVTFRVCEVNFDVFVHFFDVHVRVPCVGEYTLVISILSWWHLFVVVLILSLTYSVSCIFRLYLLFKSMPTPCF